MSSVAVLFFHRPLPTIAFVIMRPVPVRRPGPFCSRIEPFLKSTSDGSGHNQGYSNGRTSAKDIEDNVLLLPLLEAELANLRMSEASRSKNEQVDTGSPPSIFELYALRLHWFRSWLHRPSGDIDIAFIGTKLQKAGMLTKALAHGPFTANRKLPMGW